MGIDDRDDEYPTRGQSSRRRGAYDNGAPSGRSSQRGSRDDGYRSRGRGYDDADQTSGRGSSRRDYGRQDDPRSGARYERDGYDRRGRPDQSYPSSSSGRHARDDWDESGGRGGGRGGDPYAARDRAARNQRPPIRDDWDARQRGSRGPSPADSNGRGRRPGAALAQARGGLWDDAQMASAGRRRPDLRDPRAARFGAAEDEEETTSGAAAFGKALMAILLALVIGVGASYGYYVFSTPKAPPNVSPPAATPSPTKSTTGKIPAHSALAMQGHLSASIAFVFAETAN